MYTFEESRRVGTMFKKLLFLLMFIGYFPYLFLFTSVKEVKDSERAYVCHVESLGEIKENLGFGKVYYDPFGLQTTSNHTIILPYFFQHGEVKYGSCKGTNIILGKSNLPIGARIHVYTVDVEIKLFKQTLFKQTHWTMYGTTEDKYEGEKILTKLIDNREVKFFGGKRVK